MFDTLSQAQMIFLSITMFTTLYGAIKILSLVGVVAWVFSAISLIGVMAFELDLIYFWFMLMLTVIALAVGMAVRVYYNQRI